MKRIFNLPLNLVVVTAAVAAFVAIASCSPAHNKFHLLRQRDKRSEPTDMEEPSELMKRVKVIEEPLLKFSGSIFKNIRKDEENAILSPLSIHAALNLLALGTAPNTPADQELRNGLGYPAGVDQKQIDQYHQAYKSVISHFQELTKRGIEAMRADEADKSPYSFGGPKPPVIDFFNTIISSRTSPLNQDYKKRTAEFYNSTVEQINLQNPKTVRTVVDKINKWAKDAGFESDILGADEFGGDFAAMLLSAVRVQAFWFKEFNEIQHKEIFYNFGLKDRPVDGKQLGKSDLRVRLVEFCAEDKANFKHHQTLVKEHASSDLNDLADLQFRAIEIPLEGGVSFSIFEPLNNGTGTELKQLTSKLLEGEGAKLNKALKVLDGGGSSVELSHFSMPKFSFESNIDLIGPLRSMGLNKIFEKDDSGISNLIQGEPVHVDKAKHQAVIEVNKQGLKAAGVTKLTLNMLSAMYRSERIDISVKHPFMFMIRYETLPLFIGQLVKV